MQCLIVWCLWLWLWVRVWLFQVFDCVLLISAVFSIDWRICMFIRTSHLSRSSIIAHTCFGYWHHCVVARCLRLPVSIAIVIAIAIAATATISITLRSITGWQRKHWHFRFTRIRNRLILLNFDRWSLRFVRFRKTSSCLDLHCIDSLLLSYVHWLITLVFGFFVSAILPPYHRDQVTRCICVFMVQCCVSVAPIVLNTSPSFCRVGHRQYERHVRCHPCI